MERKLPWPGFWMAALVVVGVLCVQLALGVALGIIDVVIGQVLHGRVLHLERQPLFVGGINIIALGAAIALGLWLNRLPFRQAFPFGGITALQAVGAAVTILGLDILLSDADNVLRALLPVPEFLATLMKELFMSGDRLLSRIFLLVIVAPLTEELLFRGIILRGLLARYRPAVAVVLTAFLFAALHCNPWQFFSPLFLGILFGWFYLRTRSVWLCVLSHAISNGLAILATLLPFQVSGMTVEPGELGPAGFQPWWLDLSGLALLLVGLWIFRRAAPPAQPPAPSVPEAPPIIAEVMARESRGC